MRITAIRIISARSEVKKNVNYITIKKKTSNNGNKNNILEKIN